MDPALDRAAAYAARYLDGVAERRVFPDISDEELEARVSLPLADDGVDPAVVVEELAEAADPGITATVGGRYFGFVIGGALPAARAADWLVSTWDQSGPSPAVRAIEKVTARWALELLGLPSDCTVGFVTGAQAGSTTGLAAGRHHVLERVGYDVERDGLAGA